MDNILETKLQRLADDKQMIEAIKVVFSEIVEKEKPEINETTDNNIIGEKYRAYHQAIKIIEEIFLTIDSYKNIKVGSEDYNKGK